MAKLKKGSGKAKAIWMTFDLGVQGDYTGLYEWLDEREALEIGDNAAVLSFPYKTAVVPELVRSLKRNVDLGPRARVYIVREEDGRTKGTFIVGKRKRAPWEGYATGDGAAVPDDSESLEAFVQKHRNKAVRP